jgi:hypothetical protein
MKYNNCVIEVLNKEHGKRVIKWWEKQGVNTCGNLGQNTKYNNNPCRFYGLINGSFDCYNIVDIDKPYIKIIILPEELPLPREVYVWNDKFTSKEKCCLVGILIGNADYPYVVSDIDINEVLKGEEYTSYFYKHMEELHNNNEKEELLKKADELIAKANELKESASKL